MQELESFEFRCCLQNYEIYWKSFAFIINYDGIYTQLAILYTINGSCWCALKIWIKQLSEKKSLEECEKVFRGRCRCSQ